MYRPPARPRSPDQGEPAPRDTLAVKASIAWSRPAVCSGGDMTVRSHAEILAALARIRSILDEVSADTKRTATQHERLAAWHTKRGEAHAARNQRHAATVQQLKLADVAAAFDALDLVAVAVRDLDPANTPALPRSPQALPPGVVVTAADSFLNDHSEPGPRSRLTAAE
jgi:hypothetical protein